jgi:hypothetical protein
MESSTITKRPDLKKFSDFVKSRLDTTPVIVDNKDSVRVGNYTCKQEDGYWNVSYKNQIEKIFTLRSSAVAWCVATIGKNSSDARLIAHEDANYGRLVENAYVYLARFKTTTDPFKKELMWIRYDDSICQLKNKRQRLTDFLKNLKVG